MEERNGPHGSRGGSAGMEVFLEQSVVLLILAWTGGFGCAALVAGLTLRWRRQARTRR